HFQQHFQCHKQHKQDVQTLTYISVYLGPAHQDDVRRKPWFFERFRLTGVQRLDRAAAFAVKRNHGKGPNAVRALAGYYHVGNYQKLFR
ncbi:MAG: hypothetical protein WCW68_04825, partial [Methanothrix sp.]